MEWIQIRRSPWQRYLLSPRPFSLRIEMKLYSEAIKIMKIILYRNYICLNSLIVVFISPFTILLLLLMMIVFFFSLTSNCSIDMYVVSDSCLEYCFVLLVTLR